MQEAKSFYCISLQKGEQQCSGLSAILFYLELSFNMLFLPHVVPFCLVVSSGYCVFQHLHPSPINSAIKEVETNCSSSKLRFCRNIFSSLFITHLNSLCQLKFHCEIAVPIFQKFIIACGTFSLTCVIVLCLQFCCTLKCSSLH